MGLNTPGCQGPDRGTARIGHLLDAMGYGEQESMRSRESFTVIEVDLAGSAVPCNVRLARFNMLMVGDHEARYAQ
jgi:hypothetical protein